MKFRFTITVIISCILSAAAFPQQAQQGLDASIFRNLHWRNTGPANMMGRVTDVEGVPGNPNLVYVGTASGGVWKTENGGVTWIPVFDRQPVASIGDIAIEPGNPEALVKAVLQIADNKELAEAMGKAARRRVEENFSLTEFVRKYKEIYELY